MSRRVLLLGLGALASLALLPAGASASPLWTMSVSGQWECRKPGIECIDESGYAGKSAWNYPVDDEGNNCTNYVAYRLDRNGVQYPGNYSHAKFWAERATGHFPVNQTPAVGAIAQWNKGSGLTRNVKPDRGHVAYVEAVNGSTITLSDSNYEYGSKRWTVSKGDLKWPSNFIHFRDKPAPDPAASLKKYVGHIVQWSGDKKKQKTAWLVGPDLRRRWIPDIATYNCLKSRGAPGPDVLPASTLDRLKDLTGVRATCTPPSSTKAQSPPSSKAPPPPPPPPPKNIFHVHNTCADNSCGLLVETAPGSRFGGKVIGTLKDGSAIHIRCQTVGGMITGGEGSNDVWDQIDFGSGIGYVADLYVDTPGDVKAATHRYYTSSIPRC